MCKNFCRFIRKAQKPCSIFAAPKPKIQTQKLTKYDRKIQNFQLRCNSYLTPTFLLPKINPKNEPKMTQLTF